MTYNFDADEWYQRELAQLHDLHRQGKLPEELEAAVADLDQRYEEMLDRLDGTYRLPS